MSGETILVLNTGSSSVKYRLFDAANLGGVAAGSVERTEDADAVRAALADEPALGDAHVVAVGHRVVHGADRFTRPSRIDATVLDALRALIPLAPLHLPANIADIETARRLFPKAPQALPTYLHRVAGLDFERVDDALNHDSGLRALAGSNDLRDVWNDVAAGHEQAALALDVYCYRIRKYVGAYLAALGTVDAIVFTAGVGERDPGVRAGALAGLKPLGIALDPLLNDTPDRGERFVSPEAAAVPVLVVPTDEEGEIARQTRALVRSADPGPWSRRDRACLL